MRKFYSYTNSDVGRTYQHSAEHYQELSRDWADFFDGIRDEHTIAAQFYAAHFAAVARVKMGITEADYE